MEKLGFHQVKCDGGVPGHYWTRKWHLKKSLWFLKGTCQVSLKYYKIVQLRI